jgi:hypothetical protein
VWSIPEGVRDGQGVVASSSFIDDISNAPLENPMQTGRPRQLALLLRQLGGVHSTRTACVRDTATDTKAAALAEIERHQHVGLGMWVDTLVLP